MKQRKIKAFKCKKLILAIRKIQRGINAPKVVLNLYKIEFTRELKLYKYQNKFTKEETYNFPKFVIDAVQKVLL